MNKDTMLAYSKYLLFAAALIPYLVIAYVMFPLLTWSWRVGVFFPILIVPVWGALVLVKKAFFHEQTPGEEMEERERLEELQSSWQNAIRSLKASHLKDQGDPLYVLPWFLVIGESGSGKSAAVRGANLSSPFAGEASTPLSATSTCAWRFYDHGIVIETPGRYTVPSEPEQDEKEWRKLLSLIAWTRRREPINGVVVTVAADRIVGATPAELGEYGRQVRLRIEEMMRELRVHFPVYLLVTKCDLLQGMTSFFADLPQEALDQPMGLINRERDGDVQAFLERLAAAVSRRLRDLRLHLLHRPECREPSSTALLFPDLMRSLQPGLQALATAAFGKNLYQETPLLRGIYFSSAGGADPAAGEVAASKPLFLHDLFEKVLPRDRFLQGPTAQAKRRRGRVEKAAFFGWILFSLSFCVLLTCSFFRNVAVMKDAAALIGKNAELRGEANADPAEMERTAAMIRGVEEANRGWWIPRLGLNRSIEVEEALKERFCRRFRDRFLVVFDREMTGALEQFTLLTPNELFGRYVMHLSRRINLLQGRLDRNPALASAPLPDYLPPGRETGRSGFGNLYLTYLCWRSDGERLAGELQRLQTLLKQAFVAKGTDLSWLLEYVDRHEPQAAILLQQFWGGSGTLAADPAIAPSFTRKGKQRLNRLLNEIETAYPDPGVLEREKGSFSAWYRNACFAAWQKFIWQLPKGEQHLAGVKEWRVAAADMAGEKGAYSLFMRRAAMELEAFTAGDTVPLWVAELYRFQALKSSGGAPGVASTGEGKKIADKMGRFFGKEGGASPLAGTGVAREYIAAVEKIAPVARSRTLAHRMAQQAFLDTPESEKSPLFEAVDAAQRLNALLAQGEGDETFYRLITGPIAFYGTFIRMETACAIQTQWEEKVLKELQGADDPQALQYLLGKDGPVWKFLGSVADPFLGWSPTRGYYAKSALGGAVPFKPEFYSFLAKGAKAKIASSAPQRPSYQVTIRGLPTDANTEARIKPHATRLELQCATGAQAISNLNYPVSKSFIWSPGTCGDVTFQVDIGDTVLTKRYPGANGFPEFLKDFKGGRRTFHAADFPGERRTLEKMGVRFIRVNYELVGADDIVSGSPRPLPGRVPATITECWD